jgi:hypothetical protein
MYQTDTDRLDGIGCRAVLAQVEHRLRRGEPVDATQLSDLIQRAAEQSRVHPNQ